MSEWVLSNNFFDMVVANSQCLHFLTRKIRGMEQIRGLQTTYHQPNTIWQLFLCGPWGTTRELTFSSVPSTCFPNFYVPLLPGGHGGHGGSHLYTGNATDGPRSWTSQWTLNLGEMACLQLSWNWESGALGGQKGGLLGSGSHWGRN